MVDLLDRDNLHLLLEKMNNKDNSFIANVNLLATNFADIKALQNIVSQEEVDLLVDFFTNYNTDILVDDLNKSSLNGYRKLDINLIKNMYNFRDDMTQEEMAALWNNANQRLYYESVLVHFTDQTRLTKTFTKLGVPVLINNHNDLFDQFNNWTEFLTKVHGIKFDVFSDTETIGDWGLLRFYDDVTLDGNIDKIILTVTTKTINQNFDPTLAKAKEYEPTYTWIDTTSSLEIISQKIVELVAVGSNINELLQINNYLTQLLEIYAVLYKLASNDLSLETIHKRLPELLDIHSNLDVILDSNDLVSITEDIAKLERDKANMIIETVPEYYSVASEILNKGISFRVGDVLYENTATYTYRVTSVTPLGEVTSGVIAPEHVPNNKSGIYFFDNDTITGNEVSLNITCTPSTTTREVQKDLIDVYNELKADIDGLTKQVYNANLLITKLTTQLNKLAK